MGVRNQKEVSLDEHRYRVNPEAGAKDQRQVGP